MGQQSIAESVAFWESVHQPLAQPQFNPCKTCGRTSIFPVCGTCQMIADLKFQARLEQAGLRPMRRRRR